MTHIELSRQALNRLSKHALSPLAKVRPASQSEPLHASLYKDQGVTATYSKF